MCRWGVSVGRQGFRRPTSPTQFPEAGSAARAGEGCLCWVPGRPCHRGLTQSRALLWGVSRDTATVRTRGAPAVNEWGPGVLLSAQDDPTERSTHA